MPSTLCCTGARRRASPACPHPLRPLSAQHGDAFTLRLLGQRMTFVFAPAALQRYFTAPDSLLTFAPAVQQVGGWGWDVATFGWAPLWPGCTTRQQRQAVTMAMLWVCLLPPPGTPCPCAAPPRTRRSSRTACLACHPNTFSRATSRCWRRAPLPCRAVLRCAAL